MVVDRSSYIHNTTVHNYMGMRVEKMGQLNFNDFIRYYVWWLILGIASLVLGAIAGQKEAFAICLVGFVILVVGGIPISISWR